MNRRTNKSIQEKISILKTVNIFNEIPDVILRQAAELLVAVEARAGEMIFEVGDLGTCMYIIVDGQVRVHEGDLTISYLGNLDVFGEMAALDPEARSASVTAVEDTLLFQLDQQAIYQLIMDQAGFARGIIHILCQRLRGRMRDMVEDFQYMQQFARVTSAAIAVEAGIYEPESLDEVAQRTDELGQLARVFQRMERQVYQREQTLRQQVAELRIEIDEVKKANQVAEITETEYFQQLQQKAKILRSERRD
jgi:CRP-like cAMP-binding protein